VTDLHQDLEGKEQEQKKLAWTTGSMLSAAKPNKESKD
jgi:hypothetical protein